MNPWGSTWHTVLYKCCLLCLLFESVLNQMLWFSIFKFTPENLIILSLCCQIKSLNSNTDFHISFYFPVKCFPMYDYRQEMCPSGNSAPEAKCCYKNSFSIFCILLVRGIGTRLGWEQVGIWDLSQNACQWGEVAESHVKFMGILPVDQILSHINQ